MNNQRFGMLFSTSENSHYFYDSGTGKVASCNCDERDFIDRILNNELSLEEAYSLDQEFAEFIAAENLFACPERRNFMIPEKEEFVELVKGNCEQIILELTEACNLRCGYCIYNAEHPEYRGFSNKNMSFDIAKKSIDYILNDYKKDEFSLTFYGGEPLVNFELMKKSINYTRDKYPNIKLNIAFTTNLTLLTEEMVEYFNKLDSIDIMCSIDGPKSFHDKYRRYVNGEGTFDDAIRGLKLLLNKFYDNKKGRNFSINCVIIPPYSKKNLDILNNFFYEELKLPKDITCTYSYLDRGDMVFDFDRDSIIASDIERKLESSPLEEWAVDSLIEDNQNQKYFDIVSEDMLRVAKRMRVDDGVIVETYFHGNCVPGRRRVYVTVDGIFTACEKIGKSPMLGDFENGYNFDEIYKVYYEDYVEYFENICKDCWAQPMCSICYDRTIGKDGVIASVEDSVCSGSKRVVKDALINYYRLLETDRDALAEALGRYEVK